jgi:hypothetical protein
MTSYSPTAFASVADEALQKSRAQSIEKGTAQAVQEGKETVAGRGAIEEAAHKALAAP